MALEFDGLVAAVTGGASGIGAAVVQQLQQQGATVAVIDQQADDAASDLSITCDVSRRSDVDEAFARIERKLGRLDVLVNNAGIASRGPIDEVDDDELTHVLNVNVGGMFRTIRAAVPLISRSRSAAIVNTCSVSALRGMPGLSVYSASKGAVLAMTRALAAELLDRGVRVNCVCPGTVDTPWVARQLADATDVEGRRRALAARQPMSRLISADEVARAILHLASPQSESVTGTALEVDGGLVGLALAGREAVEGFRKGGPDGLARP